jgi:hypothetical protein
MTNKKGQHFIDMQPRNSYSASHKKKVLIKYQRRRENEKDYLQHHLFHVFYSGLGLERELPTHVKDRGLRD